MTQRWLLLLTMCTIGCATAPPPRQLLDARAAYNKAKSGKAAQLTPAELHTARVALNDAEAAYQNDAESEDTYTKAYVALRTAQLVETQANTKYAEDERDKTRREIEDARAEEMARTRQELALARQRLSATGQELANKEAALAKTEDQLAAERAARAAAEEREREAMRKLAAAAALAVKEESRGTVIILPGNVLFGSGKSELTPGAQSKLAMVADTLAPQSQDHDIVVEGHTDSQGSRDLNMGLSHERAMAVLNYLAARGVNREALSAVGVGPDRPIGDNNTAEGRQQNRRVEIIVKPMKE